MDDAGNSLCLRKYCRKETYRGLDDDRLTYLGLPTLMAHYYSCMDR